MKNWANKLDKLTDEKRVKDELRRIKPGKTNRPLRMRGDSVR